MNPQIVRDTHDDLVRLFEAGKIDPLISQTVALAEVPAALGAARKSRHLRQDRVRGGVTHFPSAARDYLTKQQYATDANLAARQAIYRFQQPRRQVWNETLDLAKVHGDESVLDVGCGNGTYLWALRQRQHRGLVAATDLSRGMLDAARTRSSDAAADGR